MNNILITEYGFESFRYDLSANLSDNQSVNESIIF